MNFLVPIGEKRPEVLFANHESGCVKTGGKQIITHTPDSSDTMCGVIQCMKVS